MSTKYFRTNLPQFGSDQKPAAWLHLFLSVYLDGLKSRDELYNQVFEDIQNKLLNCL